MTKLQVACDRQNRRLCRNRRGVCLRVAERNVRASDLVLTLGGVWIDGEPVFPSRLVGTETLTQVEAETPVC